MFICCCDTSGEKPERMDDLLAALRAVAEPTRLRLLVLCARGELTVSELTQILGQSQPRVSRHLKLLCDAGLLDRFREGSWVFYRLADRPGERAGPAAGGGVRRDRSDDRARSAAAERDQAAARRCSPAPISATMPRSGTASARSMSTSARSRRRWSRSSPRPTRAICSISAPAPGACSRSWRPRVEHALGIDQSREMLAVARVNLERAGLRKRAGPPRRHVSVAAAGRLLRRGGDPSGAALCRSTRPRRSPRRRGCCGRAACW